MRLASIGVTSFISTSRAMLPHIIWSVNVFVTTDASVQCKNIYARGFF